MRQLASRQYTLYRELAARALEPIRARHALGGDEAAAIAELVAVTFDRMVLAWLADPHGASPETVFRMLAMLIEARLTPEAGRDLSRPVNMNRL